MWMQHETNGDWTSDLKTKITIRCSLVPPQAQADAGWGVLEQLSEALWHFDALRYGGVYILVAIIDKGCVLVESFTGKGVVCFCKDEMCLAQPPCLWGFASAEAGAGTKQAWRGHNITLPNWKGRISQYFKASMAGNNEVTAVAVFCDAFGGVARSQKKTTMLHLHRQWTELRGQLWHWTQSFHSPR